MKQFQVRTKISRPHRGGTPPWQFRGRGNGMNGHYFTQPGRRDTAHPAALPSSMQPPPTEGTRRHAERGRECVLRCMHNGSIQRTVNVAMHCGRQ